MLLVLALCVAFTVTFADVVISKEIAHVCKGMKCSECKKISELKILLKSIKYTSFDFCLVALLIFFIYNTLIFSKFKFYYTSAVILKTRANH